MPGAGRGVFVADACPAGGLPAGTVLGTYAGRLLTRPAYQRKLAAVPQVPHALLECPTSILNNHAEVRQK